MNASSTTLPQWKMEDCKDHLQPAIATESAWIENAMPIMRERILNEQAILWAAFHAKLQPQVLDPPSIIALLPLFFEKADTPAMIKHGMNIVKEITSYLNPALAYDSIRGDSSLEEPFEKWRSKMIKKSPAYLYWDIILQIEVFVLIFIRSHREKNFPLYVEALDALMFMYFAVNYYNYSRWVSVHIRDMKSLPKDVKEDFMKNWVVQKTCRRFSAVPLAQTHEQENAKVKGKGGAVGLTENPSTLQR